jgi:hypothetical protein
MAAEGRPDAALAALVDRWDSLAAVAAVVAAIAAEDPGAGQVESDLPAPEPLIREGEAA